MSSAEPVGGKPVDGMPVGRTMVASTRAIVSLLVGLVAGAVAAFAGPWQLAVLIGVDSAAVVQLVWVWSNIRHLDGEATKAVAMSEDNSRTASSVLVVGACLASLIGVVLGLFKAKDVQTAQQVVLTVSGVLGVALAWAVVHTVFVLHYAHMYYRGEPGGIDFNSDDSPTYHDFAYFGFTIGMTFQVSDTDISDATIRRTVTRHALISYVFGTVIVGLTINVMAGLIR